ncbi:MULTISPECIES: glycosyltransferase [unclassified Brenneria]|uniref:glycosyltransferase n=1 Tax=unclassified Brenneria TaxID=2634434 RepID=UPI0029C45F7E|nr:MULTISPECIES: glycosyltransferase [unclassified Brenneria]MDX5627793.1 glycosyltransferase [Brenneria sp. L3-3Z]MDX5695116.1 glycosyltransferase [Brenneria sp. L4-2C]
MNICAVIVTYNRAELLEMVLKRFEEIVSPPDSIIIVDNNSTDRTSQVINDWFIKTKYKSKFLLSLNENIGGSGGFHEGFKYALTLKPDWIWVSDDDAFPEVDCFHVIRSKLAEINQSDYSAICGAVIDKGKIDVSHRRALVKKYFFLQNQKEIDIHEYEKDEFSIDLFSYVGVVINAKKLDKAGVTEREYFIWYDDTEHSWRLRKIGKILCVPNAKINHDTLSSNTDISWKTFYGVRNKMLMYKKHAYLTYLYEMLLLKLKILLQIRSMRNSTTRDLYRRAIFSAKANRKGVDEKYKPGFKF